MIISASRRTDLPAWYYDWFLERLECGSVMVRNPFSFHQISQIPLTLDVVDGIVFWSKNPAPMLGHMEPLREYPFYIHFTLNAYGKDVEPGLPPLNERLETFERLSDLLGPDRVLWRYDPIILNERYTPEWHRAQFHFLCSRLAGKTDLCTFSFLDFYTKIKSRLRSLNIRPWTEALQKEMARMLSEIACEHGISLAACAETGGFSDFGIRRAHCIDAKRLEKISGISLRIPEDKSQRSACGCCQSIDIGQYDTCPSGCIYCYANMGRAKAGNKAFGCPPGSPLLCTQLQEKDRITLRNVRSFRDGQLSFPLE